MPSRSGPGSPAYRAPTPPCADPPPSPLVALSLLVAVSPRLLPPDRPPQAFILRLRWRGEARPSAHSKVHAYLIHRDAKKTSSRELSFRHQGFSETELHLGVSPAVQRLCLLRHHQPDP